MTTKYVYIYICIYQKSPRTQIADLEYIKKTRPATKPDNLGSKQRTWEQTNKEQVKSIKPNTTWEQTKKLSTQLIPHL